MAMNITCPGNYPPLPPVPPTANDSNIFVHPPYKPNSGDIFQMISTSMARSTFSTNDVQSLLKNLFNNNFNSWNVSEIIKTKPIPSIIIYTSIALALFLIFSITFCVVSCCNSNKHQERKKRQSKTVRVCVCLLIIVYLLGIGDMIYVAYRVNKLKLSIDDTIKVINRDVYPKEISQDLEYLIKQFNTLDQYCIDPNSILINASKSMLVKAFDRILKEKYFVQDILQSVNNIDVNIRELNDEIVKEPTIPPSAIELFDQFQERYQDMIDYIEIPLMEVCIYANETETDIDKKLLEALNIVHVQLRKVIDTINQDILNEITPWQNNMLMDTDLEEQIRGYISLAGTILFVLVIVLGIIPLGFFIFIIICRLCGCSQNDSSENNSDRIPMTNVMEVTDTSSTNGYHDNDSFYPHPTSNKMIPRPKKVNSKNGSSSTVLCLMRIAFVVMIIMLIIMVLVTGIYYALDLVLQGTCRTVHDDQPFLINFITDKLIEYNVMFGNRSEMNTTVTNIINDCRDQVHFSRKLVENYWSTLDNDVYDMMNTLSKKIFDQFIKSIGAINIPSDIDLLVQFVNQANLSNITNIVERIDTNLIKMKEDFEKVNSSNSILPQNLVQTTINEFEVYLKKVLESTTDSCPLPLATIYKTDILVCHTLGSSLSGLWLNIFFFMFLTIVGLCIFGVVIYKRLNSSFGFMPSRITRF